MYPKCCPACLCCTVEVIDAARNKNIYRGKAAEGVSSVEVKMDLSGQAGGPEWAHPPAIVKGSWERVRRQCLDTDLDGLAAVQGACRLIPPSQNLMPAQWLSARSGQRAAV